MLVLSNAVLVLESSVSTSALPGKRLHIDFEYRFAEYEYRFAEYEYRFAEYEYEYDRKLSP